MVNEGEGQTETIAANDGAAQPTAPVANAPTASDDGEATVLGSIPAVDETAPAEGAATEEVAGAPEKYEFALEGMEIDAALAEAADPVLRSMNLTNEQANTLLPLAQKLMQNVADRQIQSLIDGGAQQRKAWLDAFHTDPDIGGANVERTTHLAAKGMAAMGFTEGHPFAVALAETGFGNHPDMIRAFRTLGELAGESLRFVRSDAGAAAADPLTEMYPNNRRSK